MDKYTHGVQAEACEAPNEAYAKQKADFEKHLAATQGGSHDCYWHQNFGVTNNCVVAED
jgi:hypothetical protein